MRKILAILLSAIVFVAQLACKFAKEPEKVIPKEFEGIITYHEIAISSDDIFNEDDTVQLFYAHGNFVGVHSDKLPKYHLVKDYFFANKSLRLLLFNTSDTLYQLGLNLPGQKLEGFTVQKVSDQILSRKCENIAVNISFHGKDSVTYTDLNFTFSREYLKIDKQHFKNWNLGYFNKVVDESGAFYLRFKSIHFDSSHKNILSSKTYDVISVKETPIDPKIFEIDTTKINWTK